MKGTQTIQIKGHRLMLLPTGALYWPKYKALFIADLHIGKVEHFRKEGLAIPAAVGAENYQKLDAVTQGLDLEQLYFLGDLFHSKKNTGWDRFFGWVEQQDFKITLIVGNHDRHDLKAIPEGSFELLEALELEGMVFTHEPVEDAKMFNICGHIHPGLLMRGKGRLVAKVPCFAQEKNRLIIPAFGVFTGNHPVDLKQMQKVYICTGEEVLVVK